jgi:hypothetical protein
LPDLKRVFPAIHLFDRVVAKNGALIYDPDTEEERALVPARPAAFLEALGQHGVTPLSASVLIAGRSGIGKSTLAIALTERIAEKEFEFCIFDPEGDYDGTSSRIVSLPRRHRRSRRTDPWMPRKVVSVSANPCDRGDARRGGGVGARRTYAEVALTGPTVNNLFLSSKRGSAAR